MASMSEWEMGSYVHGYHIYQSVWTPTLDDELICVRHPFNSINRYAVTVKNGDAIVGPLPKKISRLCSLFLQRGGSIASTVTGRRRYSSDLSQKIPYSLLFTGETKEIDKLKRCCKTKCKTKLETARQ